MQLNVWLRFYANKNGPGPTLVLAPTHLEQLVDVVANVIIAQCGVQDFEICVVYIFKDQGRSFGLGVAHDIEQLNDVWPTMQVLQNLNLPLDL